MGGFCRCGGAHDGTGGASFGFSDRRTMGNTTAGRRRENNENGWRCVEFLLCCLRLLYAAEERDRLGKGDPRGSALPFCLLRFLFARGVECGETITMAEVGCQYDLLLYTRVSPERFRLSHETRGMYLVVGQGVLCPQGVELMVLSRIVLMTSPMHGKGFGLFSILKQFTLRSLTNACCCSVRLACLFLS